jgi:hypothetical protein
MKVDELAGCKIFSSKTPHVFIYFQFGLSLFEFEISFPLIF